MNDDEIREDGADTTADDSAEGSDLGAGEGAEDSADDAAQDGAGDDEAAADAAADTDVDDAADDVEVETAFYRITGLVDAFDEQGNIVSQYPVGSKQELPVDRGEAAVAAGQAELITDEAED